LKNEARKEMLEDLYKDLKDCSTAMDFKDIDTDTYDKTKERIALLEEIITKHRPDALVDIFEYNGRNLDAWDEEEHVENTTKNEFYKERTAMPLSKIVEQVQQRVSYFNIYELMDNITANKIKIKKIRNQVRIEKKDVDLLKE
jgi:hypothetical protein